jgi:hypothetical protein
MISIENKKIGIFPKWFIVFMTINYTIGLPILAVYTFVVIYNNKGVTIFGFLLLALLLGSFLIIYMFFSSVTATSNGLVAGNKFGRKTTLLWDQIIEMRRYHFGSPNEFTSVISKNGKKLYLLKSMSHYKELIEYIKNKAINLKITED